MSHGGSRWRTWPRTTGSGSSGSAGSRAGCCPAAESDSPHRDRPTARLVRDVERGAAVSDLHPATGVPARRAGRRRLRPSRRAHDRGHRRVVRRGHDTSVVVIAPREVEHGASSAARSDVVVLACRLWRLQLPRAPPRARAARHPSRHHDGGRPLAGTGVDPGAPSTDTAVVMTRWATSVRWGAALGALVAGVLVVFVAASAAGADGRRGTVIFGIAGVAFLIAGLVVSSGVYPAALVALAVAFSFSLAGHHVASGRGHRRKRAAPPRRSADGMVVRRRDGRDRTRPRQHDQGGSHRRRRGGRSRTHRARALGRRPSGAGWPRCRGDRDRRGPRGHRPRRVAPLGALTRAAHPLRRSVVTGTRAVSPRETDRSADRAHDAHTERSPKEAP